MPIGSVARFDCRRGYGFVIPDDGSEDIFVHQNDIEMDGFRFLQPGERVNYELEVGEKGMKAVGVALVEPRPESQNRTEEQGGQDERPARKPAPRKKAAPQKTAALSSDGEEKTLREIDKLRRKQERLISILVEKGIMQPGEIDGIAASAEA